MKPNNGTRKQRGSVQVLGEIARFLGGSIRKVGQSRYRGGRSLVFEGPKGARAYAHFKTVFLRGKPIGSRIVAWGGM